MAGLDLGPAIAARQQIDARNREDADYIAGHPRDFSPAEVAQAHRTLDQLERDAAPRRLRVPARHTDLP